MGAMKSLLITVYGGGDEAVAAAERLAGLRRWTPVQELLPDRYIRVLAFVACQPYEHAHAIGFVNSLGVWSLDEPYGPSAAVTHWMPLPPDPPKRGDAGL